jgi:hypothetical protein
VPCAVAAAVAQTWVGRLRHLPQARCEDHQQQHFPSPPCFHRWVVGVVAFDYVAASSTAVVVGAAVVAAGRWVAVVAKR